MMIALALLVAFFSQSAVPEYDGGWNSRFPTRDTSRAIIRAWRESNRRIRETRQAGTDEDTLHLVGRWPFAGSYRVRPSWDFTNDSIVYVSSGSGVRILKASDPRRPQTVGQVNCYGSLYLTEFETRDTLLFVVYSYSMGLQVFSIAAPSAPYELGRLELDGDVTGLGLRGGYAFVVGWDSLFRVIDVSNPRQPRQVRTLLLPLDGLSVDVKGDYAYVGGSFAGLVAVDVSDPLNPQLRGQVGGFDAMSVVCDPIRPYVYVASREDGLQVISIADPGSPSRAGSLATGDAWDVFKADTFVYLVGTVAPYQSNLFVVSVANPAQPRLVGQSRADGWAYGVYALSPFSYAYTCDGWEGIHVRSLANPGNPVVDTAMYGAWTGEDLAVQDSLVFYANSWAGLKVLSASDPELPREIGLCDSSNRTPFIKTIAVADSFGFTMWRDGSGNQYFRSLNLTDPRAPIPSGVSLTLWEAKAIVLRDTLAFVAEDYKFEVYNVARPRQPVRIGRCDLVDEARDMCIQGDHAFVVPRLQIVDISDPSAPALVQCGTSWSWGLDVVDTIAFVASLDESLEVYSVANITMPPRRMAAVPIAGPGCDVDVAGRTAYVGSYYMEAFDVTNPASPTRVAAHATPYGVAKIRHDSALVYAACADGGLCIFRTCSTGIAEDRTEVRGGQSPVLSPSPTTGRVRLRLTNTSGGIRVISVRDATGREVASLAVQARSHGNVLLNLSCLTDGCYFVSCSGRTDTRPAKLVISRRR